MSISSDEETSSKNTGMKKKHVGALGIIALLFLNLKFNTNQSKHEEYFDDEINEVPRKKARVPASTKYRPSPQPEIFRPQVTNSVREIQNNFVPSASEPVLIEEGASAPNTTSFYSSGDDGNDFNRRGSGSSEDSSNKTANQGDKENSASDFPSGTFTTNSPVPGYSSGGSSNSSDDALSCSSSLGGGAYANPIEIALTCSAPSEIRYCIGVGSCCDPLSSGLVYSSKIIIGENEGDYCLSFYGRDSSDSESKTFERNYNINLTLPHLEVAHPKRYYQTTELSGMSHLASDMFGRVNFGVGVINLTSNDPGPSGLNLGCDEIVDNYMSFPGASKLVLDFFHTAGIAPTDQLNVPLRLDQLSYGDNYITTYMVDQNFVAPLYSCSTTRVRLQDFDYFQADASHAVPGTNAVREFSGGFNGYGFFEADTEVYRGPAGVGTSTLQEEVLETGLFSVFY